MAFDINIYTDSTETEHLRMRGNDAFAAIDYAKQNLVNVNQYATILHAGEVIAVVSSEAEPAEYYECPEIHDIEEALDSLLQDLTDFYNGLDD